MLSIEDFTDAMNALLAAARVGEHSEVELKLV
jgi:hypothetical protein